MRLHIRLGRFRCRTSSCPRRTFAQRLQDVARPYGRRSERLRHVPTPPWPGARRGDRRPSGAASVLVGERRHLLAARTARPVRPLNPDGSRVIGLDEWARRRGRRYGTMIVDLERNDAIDLLPHQSAATLAAWLRRRPGIEIIVRDRAEVFAEGVRSRAPRAQHIIDRWHLLCKLGDTLQGLVARRHRLLRDIARKMIDEDRAVACAEAAARRAPTAQEKQREGHAPRPRRYAEMTRLLSAGASMAAVSRTLGLDRKTTRRWVWQGGPSLWTKPKRPTVPDPYQAGLAQRWREGCRNVAQLAREFERQGVDVAPRVVRAWATPPGKFCREPALRTFGSGSEEVRRVREDGAPGVGAAPFDPKEGAEGARRRGGAHRRHRRAGDRVRPRWLPADHGDAAGGGLGGERQARRADMAAGGAQSTAEVAEERSALAERQELYPSAAGASEPCLVLRFRRGPHPRRQAVPQAQHYRRVPPGAPGDPGRPEADPDGGHRRLVRPLHASRGVPCHVRSDNGPEFIARAGREWSAAGGPEPRSSSRAALGRMAAARVSTRSSATGTRP